MIRSSETLGDRVDTVFVMMASAGALDYIGEPVSQLAHGLQAADLAARAGQPEAVILACLFHDIGHLVDESAPQMEALGVVDHELIGAQYLAGLGFSDAVCHLVSNHVQGKRYLCFRTAGYHAALSAASRGTLQWQGGPMTAAEAKHFEADPWFETILRMRVFDDRAKIASATVPLLESYRDLIERHLEGVEAGEAIEC